MSTMEFGRFTNVFKLGGGPYSVEGKGRTAFLPAVGAVADADAKGFTTNGNLHLPAKAFSRKHGHGLTYPVRFPPSFARMGISRCVALD